MMVRLFNGIGIVVGFRIILNYIIVCPNKKLQFVYVKDFIRCSARLGVGTSSFCKQVTLYCIEKL